MHGMCGHKFINSQGLRIAKILVSVHLACKDTPTSTKPHKCPRRNVQLKISEMAVGVRPLATVSLSAASALRVLFGTYTKVIAWNRRDHAGKYLHAQQGTGCKTH